MTKWERIVKSHYPFAKLERQKTHGGERVYLIRKDGSRFTFSSGDGDTPAKAWANAAKRLALNAMKGAS